MNHEEATSVIRQALDDHPSPIAHIAIRAGVSVSALNAIQRGQTKWPRHTTLFALLDVLGLRLTITRSNT